MRKVRVMMNPARYIIEKFGGLSATARALGHRNASTVQGWWERGVIPARQQPHVLEASRRLKVGITPADFIEPMSEPVATVSPHRDREAAA
jgi:hypothetical protein